jgi:hypothetical protein
LSGEVVELAVRHRLENLLFRNPVEEHTADSVTRRLGRFQFGSPEEI